VIRGTGLFQALDGIGVHEVIIESPAHDRDLGDLSLDHVREVVGVYRDRARSIAAEPQYRYVQIFKNKGPEAGATLSHPHTQILATPIVPKRVREEVESGERSWRADGRCLYCRIIGEEETAAERVVRGSGPFMAFVPFAARFPFETHIYPKRHAPSFAGIDDRELDGLAEILRDVLGRLKTVLSDPPYNLVVHQAPHPDSTRVEWPEIESFYHWHIEILPVLTKIAGFEWGTGFHINPISPELAARFLREA
jgi:UDPglucose--hexose-1-phosphate uridylyltransferase